MLRSLYFTASRKTRSTFPLASFSSCLSVTVKIRAESYAVLSSHMNKIQHMSCHVFNRALPFCSIRADKFRPEVQSGYAALFRQQPDHLIRQIPGMGVNARQLECVAAKGFLLIRATS